MPEDDRGVVVVGIDGSDHSLIALRTALAEAKARRAKLDVVYASDVSAAVLHLPGDITVDTRDLADASRAEVWSKAAPILGSTEGVEVERVDLDGYPADTLIDHCNEVGAELLVLGTRGRGRLASSFLGSTSLRALEHARCDVLIAKVGA